MAVQSALPPRNLEAEQALLGAMLKSERAVAVAIENVRQTECFYDDRHRVLYDTLREMFAHKRSIDLTTVADALRQRRQLDAVGGTLYLSTLLESVPSALNADEYARIVREKHLLRKLIGVGQELTAGAYRDTEEAQALMNTAQKNICDLASQEDSTRLFSARDLVHDVVEEMELVYKHKGSRTGVRTGFAWLDHHTRGFRGGELIILAARPSMGKTALALNIATRIALNRGENGEKLRDDDKRLPVLVFSLEMSAASLLTRVICSEARVDWGRLNRGVADPNAFVRITDVASWLMESDLHINDASLMTPLEISAQARRLATDKGQLGLIVIDYLQLMQADAAGGRRGAQENRQQEISTISRQLKALARDLNVPVLVLSQLSRQVERRDEKRPQLSDLRESGAIEQDADLVLMLYREEYYLRQQNKMVPPDVEGTAELAIAKQRSGRAGISGTLTFHGQYTRFETREIPQEEHPEAEFVTEEQG